ncbi:MAG: hypothetical protein JST53_13500 [Actinobacteria bacterium]|nr:hypothetical protein [Actinomycetota bacterium]
MTDADSKVVAVSQALVAAGIPHAIGGAIALGHHAEPRLIRDIDVNVFVPPERGAEVEAALAELDGDGPPVHLFFDEDELHATMPAAVRQVPFAGATIPIVSPEHLIVRKVTLDREKDWLDIEAILAAETPLDLDEIRAWLRRFAPERLPVFETLAMSK